MILIYLAPVPWDSIAQRPHFFVNSVLCNGTAEKVYWINPIPSRLPMVSDIRRLFSKIEPSSFSKPEKLEIVEPGKFVPIEPFPKLFKLINSVQFKNLLRKIESIIKCHKNEKIVLVIGKPSQLALTILDKFLFDITIADIMDDFPYFFHGRSRSSMHLMMKQLISKVKYVWFSSHNLEKNYSYLATKYRVILNASSSTLLSKKIQYKRNRNKIIYGYIGSINSWFDWNFVDKLAKTRPNSEIWIIGPRYIPIPLLPDNVKILPAIEHGEVGKYLSYFSYGLIPFKQNELTDSVDPVKYYEYIAYDIPVISTNFGEMKIRIDNNLACSLEGHLMGKEVIVEDKIFWEDRFTKDIFDIEFNC